MKKRIRRGDPRTRGYWQGLVRRWEGSGQTVRAFCRSEALHESAFYFWRRRLAEGNPNAADNVPHALDVTGPTSRPTRRQTPPCAPSFLPVHVVEPVASDTFVSVRRNT